MAGSQKVAAVHLAMTADIRQANANIKILKNQVTALGRRAQRESNNVKYAFNKIRRASQVVASVFIVDAFVRRLGRLAFSIEKPKSRWFFCKPDLRSLAGLGILSLGHIS